VHCLTDSDNRYPAPLWVRLLAWFVNKGIHNAKEFIGCDLPVPGEERVVAQSFQPFTKDTDNTVLIYDLFLVPGCRREVRQLIPIEKSCIFLDKILNGSSTFQPLQCPKEREHPFSHPVDRMLADSMVSFLASVCDR